MKTDIGRLHFQELEADYFSDIRRAESLNRFFIDNFISNTDEPYMLNLKKPENIDQYNHDINWHTKKFLGKLRNDDGNMTVLGGFDKKNHLQVSLISHTLNSNVYDRKTCILNGIAVNPDYRKKNIGKVLIEKLTETSKETFSDLFLAAENKAVGFYKTLGFIELDKKNCAQFYIIKSLKDNFDMKYTTFMSKPLDETAMRFWNRIYYAHMGILKQFIK